MAKSSDFMLRFFSPLSLASTLLSSLSPLLPLFSLLSLSLASTPLLPESSDRNSDFLSHNLMSAMMRIVEPKIKRMMNLSYFPITSLGFA